MKRVLAAKMPEEKLVFFIPEEKANYARVISQSTAPALLVRRFWASSPSQ